MIVHLSRVSMVSQTKTKGLQEHLMGLDATHLHPVQ